MIKKMINKNTIIIGLLLIWFIGSASYLVWSFTTTRNNTLRLEGYTAAVNDFIDQAENEECLPFEIFSGERRVTLINTKCLQQQEPAEDIPE